MIEIPKRSPILIWLSNFCFRPIGSLIWIFFSGKTSQETHDEEDEEEEDDNNSSNDETSDSDEAMQVN